MTKSIPERIGEILPGSTTFEARVLCPKCGWHFKHGITDPSGQDHELRPDAVLVCGQCLSVLKTDAQRQLQRMTKDEIAALPGALLQQVSKRWWLAFLALQLVGPEPKGKAQ